MGRASVHAETSNLSLPAQIDLDEHKQLVAKMSRYILLKGCASEAILTSKLNEEVLGDKYRKMRGVAKQVLCEAASHVRSVFGLKLVQAPKKHFPQTKFKDAFYLVRRCCRSPPVLLPP